MLSNQKLQNTLNEIREISQMETALYSGKGHLVASTEGVLVPLETEQAVAEFIDSAAEARAYPSFGLYRVAVEGETAYVLLVPGEGEQLHVYARLAVCQIRNLAAGSVEKFDRNHFIQSILLGNMLTVDIMAKAKKHHIQDMPRVVFVIDTGKKNNDVAMELVKNLADMRAGDFVTSVDAHSVVLVKDISHLAGREREEALASFASSLADNIQTEAMIKVRVGYGSEAGQLTELVRSFQEAKLALTVGRIFYAERDTVSYGKLGIGRLIYQLPTSLCRMFIREVFGDRIPDILEDEEAMSTISKFFENNLNISETARQLYVHRNTLVYRLERIEKAIGLDIRTFDDAMTFRIAMMVIAHLKDESSDQNQ
jgi:carbohydrate diacid regulator